MKATVRHNGKVLKVYLGTPQDHGLSDSAQNEDGVTLLFVDTKQAYIDAQVSFMNSGNAIDYKDLPAFIRRQAE